MATITGSLPIVGPSTAINETTDKQIYFGGLFELLEFPGTASATVVVSGSGSSGVSELTPVFRGENPPGTFVYSEGSPPVGASNIVIVSYK